MSLPLHDPLAWPVYMRREEVSHVLRMSARHLLRLVRGGRFPAAVHGTWDRDVVVEFRKTRRRFNVTTKQQGGRVISMRGKP